MLRTSARTARPLARPSPAPTAPPLLRAQISSSSSSSAASTSTSAPPPQASTSATSPPAPTLPASALPAAPTTPSHFLITLLRSPLHLPPSQRASAASLGLHKRLSSSIVPITPQNAGYVLRIKELVGVRQVSAAEVALWASREWRDRPGEGRQGSGMRVKAGANDGSVIRVGSERARGDERGFRIVDRR
ncbi:hypothetical protein JCM10449v2_007975 [Rhodotorula kratochvilovae]